MKVKINKFPRKSLDRKINIQIESFDTWSLDHTLALIILPALLQLKATKHGLPPEFGDVGGEDYVEQQSFDFYSETYPEAFEKGCARWEEVLDKMIWSFQQLALEDYDSKYHHGDGKFDWVKSDVTYTDPITGKVESTYQIVTDNSTNWFDVDGMVMHETRIQEGLDLFGKHYRALWD
jgi:hypothetical protein